MIKRNNAFLTVVFIVVVLLLLWAQSYYASENNESRLVRILFLLFLILLIFGATCFLYRKEWRQVLGLKTKDITPKVIFKAFATAILIGLIINIVTYAVYFIIFHEKPLFPLGENVDAKGLIFVALILAPLIEEFLFRGFIQGLWQRFYSNKEKQPTKLIIITTALLFTISHFGFLFNINVKQFLITLIPLFVVALYLGWLRHRYQSIIPSIFAHFGNNLCIAIMPLIAFFITSLFSNTYGEMRRQQEVAQYVNDTIPYNFDPNNMEEWQRSYKKFAVLERPRSEEIIKHLKGTATNANVYFIIDTCGNIYNVHVADSVWHEGKKCETVSIYINEYGYDFSAEAIKFIQSLPQCKPYIEDGKKVEKEMMESVPLYPY